MTSLNFDDQDGMLRTISDAPPTHYTVKVQSISLLTKHNFEKYESGHFEAGGYKWRLVFYPNGNKNRNVKEHIALYLVMSGETAPKISSEVYAVFRLFILNQNNGNYFVLQKPKERRFHGKKLDWGFDQVLAHKAFTEASNGFLIDDTCVLGTDVFISKERSKGKGERLSMVKDPVMYKNTWRIDNVSKLDAESYDSKTFIAGDQKCVVDVLVVVAERCSSIPRDKAMELEPIGLFIDVSRTEISSSWLSNICRVYPTDPRPAEWQACLW